MLIRTLKTLGRPLRSLERIPELDRRQLKSEHAVRAHAASGGRRLDALMARVDACAEVMRRTVTTGHDAEPGSLYAEPDELKAGQANLPKEQAAFAKSLAVASEDLRSNIFFLTSCGRECSPGRSYAVAPDYAFAIDSSGHLFPRRSANPRGPNWHVVNDASVGPHLYVPPRHAAQGLN